MKKYILIIICLLTLLLVGCGYSKEEIAEMEVWKKQGEENIRNYIKEKYGTDIHITKIVVAKEDTGPIPDFSPDYISTVYVKGTINGEECCVITTNANTISTEKCYDNYQTQEITDDLLMYVQSDLFKDNEIFYSYLDIYEHAEHIYSNSEATRLFHIFYDGNISKFLESEKLDGEITVVLIGKTIKDCEEKLLSINDKITVDIQNYEQEIKNVSTPIWAIESPYLKEIYCNYEYPYGKAGYQFRDIKSYDNFLYTARFGTTTDFDFSCYETVNLDNWGSNYKIVSDIYHIPSFEADIFFDIEKLEGYCSNSKYVILYQYTNDDNETKYLEAYQRETDDDKYLHFAAKFLNGYWFVAEKTE